MSRGEGECIPQHFNTFGPPFFGLNKPQLCQYPRPTLITVLSPALTSDGVSSKVELGIIPVPVCPYWFLPAVTRLGFSAQGSF